MSYYADQLREFFTHDVTDCAADYIEKLESQVAQLETELEQAKKDQARYEYMRRLNVPQFHQIFMLNLSSNIRFDECIDAAIASILETGK
jgi:Mg2+ and Co2+ transporter CorA